MTNISNGRHVKRDSTNVTNHLDYIQLVQFTFKEEVDDSVIGVFELSGK